MISDLLEPINLYMKILRRKIDMLYYLPLEPYIERYTYLMSAKDGWA